MKMRTRFSSVGIMISAICLIGCGQNYVEEERQDPDDFGLGDDLDEEDEETDPEGGDDPVDEPQAFTPTEGQWTTTDEYLPVDACNMGDWVSDGPGGTIEIYTTGEDSLEIIHEKGTYDCVFDEVGFECLSIESEDTTAQDEYSLDALIVLELTAMGSFNGKDSLEMLTEIVATCEGDQCWLVELATAAFPCGMQLLKEIEAG
jgi:hypothetical protein